MKKLTQTFYYCLFIYLVLSGEGLIINSYDDWFCLAVGIVSVIWGIIPILNGCCSYQEKRDAFVSRIYNVEVLCRLKEDLVEDFGHFCDLVMSAPNNRWEWQFAVQVGAGRAGKSVTKFIGGKQNALHNDITTGLRA